MELIYVVDLDDYSAAAKGEIEMIALALRCITVYDAAAEAIRAIDVLQNGRKRSEGTVSVVQSVLLDVDSTFWCANRLRTISLITVRIAQHGPILVSCLKDIGSASVTGSAECLPTLQKMFGDVSRAKQALPSEFTSAAAQALWGHLVDFGKHAGEQRVRVIVDGDAKNLQVCDRDLHRVRRLSRHQRGHR